MICDDIDDHTHTQKKLSHHNEYTEKKNQKTESSTGLDCEIHIFHSISVHKQIAQYSRKSYKKNE